MKPSKFEHLWFGIIFDSEEGKKRGGEKKKVCLVKQL